MTRTAIAVDGREVHERERERNLRQRERSRLTSERELEDRDFSRRKGNEKSNATQAGEGRVASPPSGSANKKQTRNGGEQDAEQTDTDLRANTVQGRRKPDKTGTDAVVSGARF